MLIGILDPNEWTVTFGTAKEMAGHHYTNSQGRLNQWAYWARAQGPRIFAFEGPPTGCGEMNSLKLIILLLPLMKPSSG